MEAPNRASYAAGFAAAAAADDDADGVGGRKGREGGSDSKAPLSSLQPPHALPARSLRDGCDV